MSAKKPRFTGLCVGYQVFVVPQHRGPKSISGTQPVVKIGRKYGYVMLYDSPSPFCLETGRGDPNDQHNARANGFSFDAYNSEAEYMEIKTAKDERERLAKRLRDLIGFDGVKLSHPAVMRIHAILDEEQASKQEVNA